jgi:hypothetical protein
MRRSDVAVDLLRRSESLEPIGAAAHPSMQLIVVVR